MVSRERFAQGMTFDQYVKFMSTPENLRRQGSFNRPRRDYGEYFRKAYLVPALEAGLIEMTLPDRPTSRAQRYRLAETGKALRARRRRPR